MTLEELKAEAKAQGYNLIPIKKLVKMEPCKCGANLRERWYSSDGTMYIRCIKCGFTSKTYAKSENEARLAWNKAVKETD